MPARALLSRLGGAFLALALVSVVLATGTPAHALDAPTGLASSGESAGRIPMLSWDRVPGATGYDVQVSTSGDFAVLLWSASTVSTRTVPEKQIPFDTPVWWRVKARGDAAAPWTAASFVRSAAAAPSLVGPPDGAELQPPVSQPALTWSQVPGAESYTVLIGTDSNFTDPTRFKTATTERTSYVPTDLPSPTTYYWKVQAQLATTPAIRTAWSEVRSYAVLALSQPTRQSPTHGQVVEDVVLDWTPVPGAVRYDLQISPNEAFQTEVTTKLDIHGTRYSPPVTLDNDQYYWRVRPVNAENVRPDWPDRPEHWMFKREWPRQPDLTYPVGGVSVGDPLYYQWSPVKLASEYELQLSTSELFDQNVQRCKTVHTTFTPWSSPGPGCMPGAAGRYFWRVIALDSPHNPPIDTAEIAEAIEVGVFNYDPQRVTVISPGHGATVTVPTLSWQPVARAAMYKVTITSLSTGAQVVEETAATSFTPRSALAEGGHRWQVQTVSADKRLGTGITAATQRTFTVAPQEPGAAARPEPLVVPGGPHQHFPTLRWTPVTNANKYRVLIRPEGGTGYQTLKTDATGGSDAYFAYPAGEDLGNLWLAPGTYEWHVEAWKDNTPLGVSSSNGTFEMAPFPAVTGHQAALTGNNLFARAGRALDSCDMRISESGAPVSCVNLRQSPVLTWDADADVSSYRLYVARDAELTNRVVTLDVPTNLWAPTTALPDAQAGSESQLGSAYYVHVVPCRSGRCPLPSRATRAFNKLSHQVQPVSPAHGATLADDVTLTWRDLLATSADRVDAGATSLGTPAEVEAHSYRVQTSTDPNFTTFLDNVVVDQTTFTSFDTTYPEGPIYWRVQAVDHSRNALPWSAQRAFTKVSPSPVLTAPVRSAEAGSDQRLSWTPLEFAASYDLEVRRDTVNGTVVGSVPTNTKQASAAPTKALAPGTYVWRVRRVDAKGRKGAWSDWESFRVTTTAPVLLGPVPGTDVPPSSSLFSWQQLLGAARYRFERRLAGAGSTAETVTTAALDYVPKSAIGQGAWEWRVVALDTNSAEMGASPWWGFSVRDTPAALGPVRIDGAARVGSVLTASGPEWDMPDVTTTYQWRQDGRSITGATGPTYTPAATDHGRQITVVATGTRTGYKSGTAVSAAVVPGVGPALVPGTRPTVTGTPTVGSTLTADPGSWPGSPRFAYQWLRDAAPVSGATGSTYRLTVADAGRVLAVRVTATASGFAPGAATSGDVVVGRLGSTTNAVLPLKRVPQHQRGRVQVTVTVPGVAHPLGRITVRRGTRILVSRYLDGDDGGRVVLRLPRLRPGRHRLAATYGGSLSTNGSRSRVVALVITR